MWDSSNPLDHHLVFPSLPPITSDEENGIQEQEETEKSNLTAREVFALKLQQGVHLNLIACSGGLTDVKAGDEVMGLLPALLYSGASSTVSTLWPILDHVGAKFSRAFFISFAEQVRNAEEVVEMVDTEGQAKGLEEGDIEKGKIWVDIAMAMRDAVIELDPDQTAPLLTWAGFVLHGFWMFCVDDGVEVGGLQGA